jgi:hypothetical protein
VDESLYTPLALKMTVFWDVVPYNLVEINRRFKDVCSLHNQGAATIMEAVSTF